MLNAITFFSIGACIVFTIRTSEAAAVVSKEDCPEKFSSLSGTGNAQITIENSTQTTAMTIDSKSIVSTTESTKDDITSVFPKGTAEMSTVTVKELATSVPVTTASSTTGQKITAVSETTFTTSVRPTTTLPTTFSTSTPSTSTPSTSTTTFTTSVSPTTILSTTFSTSIPSSTSTSATEEPRVPESECHDSSMFCSGFRRLCNAPRGCTRRRQARSLPLNRQDDEIACVWVRMQKRNPALGLAVNECDESLRRPQLNLGVHGGSYQSRMNMSPRRPRRLDCGVHKIVSTVFAALCPASCGECD